MKRGIFQMIVAVGVISAASSGLARLDGGKGESVTGQFMKTDAERATVYALAAGAFRESAMSAPDRAVEIFFAPAPQSTVQAKWKSKVTANMIVQQVTDFFMGSIMLSGPVGDKESIVGLYNPWWDAILLLKMRDENKVGGTSDVKVTDFILQCGETFRGESVSTNHVKCVTVVPEKDPMSVELWRVVSKTRKSFMSVLPMDGKPTWGRVAAKALRGDWSADLTVLQTRSLLRLQHSVGLLKNARDTGIAAFLTRLARHGTKLQLFRYFGKKDCAPLRNTFGEIPEMFRKDFLPYCYVPTAQGTLYVLINKKMPRLYMTVTLEREIKSATSGMEWYDLMQADELLAAWNSREGAGE